MTAAILKLAIFFLVGAGMAALPVALSFLLWRETRRSTKDETKRISFSRAREPYESGMIPVGSGRAVGFEYLIYAVLFLLLDGIAVLLFLGLAILRENKSQILPLFLGFLALTFLLIAYGARQRDYLRT